MLPSVGSVVSSAPTHLAEVVVSITTVTFGTECWAVNLVGEFFPCPVVPQYDRVGTCGWWGGGFPCLR